jgi:hypothetical protein
MLCWLSSNPCGGHLRPEGSDEADIFCHFVDILTVGNLDLEVGTQRQLTHPCEVKKRASLCDQEGVQDARGP